MFILSAHLDRPVEYQLIYISLQSFYVFKKKESNQISHFVKEIIFLTILVPYIYYVKAPAGISRPAVHATFTSFICEITKIFTNCKKNLDKAFQLYLKPNLYHIFHHNPHYIFTELLVLRFNHKTQNPSPIQFNFPDTSMLSNPLIRTSLLQTVL